MLVDPHIWVGNSLSGPFLLFFVGNRVQFVCACLPGKLAATGGISSSAYHVYGQTSGGRAGSADPQPPQPHSQRQSRYRGAWTLSTKRKKSAMLSSPITRPPCCRKKPTPTACMTCRRRSKRLICSPIRTSTNSRNFLEQRPTTGSPAAGAGSGCKRLKLQVRTGTGRFSFHHPEIHPPVCFFLPDHHL